MCESLIRQAVLLIVHYVNLKYLVPKGGSRLHGCKLIKNVML